jgi:antitoxin MazE
MRTKIQKWGNSLGLRIPKAFAQELAIRDGSAVEITVSEGQILIRPQPRALRLADLLKEITDDNVHAEISTGEPRGRESW